MGRQIKKLTPEQTQVFNKIKKLLTNKTYTYNDIRSIVWSLEEFIDENLFFKAGKQ
jgi:hypothetical protein